MYRKESIMYMVKITKDKYEHLAETAEQMLRYGGKLMQCIEEMKEEDSYTPKMGYNPPGGMNYRYPIDVKEPMDVYEEPRGKSFMKYNPRMY